MPVQVRFADVRREVDTVAELDEILEPLDVDDEPILVELAGGAAVLNLGVGRRDAAVAMFRDADGQPWFGRSDNSLSFEGETELAFAKNGTRYEFFASAAIAPSEMREAAREFVRTPGERPSTVTWVREGVDANTTDRNERGS